jgi:hypothetical protein
MAKLDRQISKKYHQATFPRFHEVLQAHFPGALPLEDYLQQTCRHLKPCWRNKNGAKSRVYVHQVAGRFSSPQAGPSRPHRFSLPHH